MLKLFKSQIKKNVIAFWGIDNPVKKMFIKKTIHREENKNFQEKEDKKFPTKDLTKINKKLTGAC